MSLFIYFLTLFIFNFSFAFEIIIDPGHGGQDQGARYYGKKESEIVLSIAEKIKNELEKNTDQYQVKLTRNTNQFLPLEKRITQGNNLEKSLIISLHANSSTDKRITGTEIYFQTDKKQKQNLDEVESIKQDLYQLGRRQLSLMLAQDLKVQNIHSKTVLKRADFYVIENSTTPALLIEIGFLSNEIEAKNLSHPDYQLEIAQKIARGITDYLNKMK